MSINFNEEQVPDATTLLKFRHLLEKNHLKRADVKGYQGGTIVDATIINAPSSTKIRRNPELPKCTK